MAAAEVEEVDLDAAEEAWEEAERLTLAAAEAEAEAELIPAEDAEEEQEKAKAAMPVPAAAVRPQFTDRENRNDPALIRTSAGSNAKRGGRVSGPRVALAAFAVVAVAGLAVLGFRRWGGGGAAGAAAMC